MNRWKKTDQILRAYLPKIREEFEIIKEKALGYYDLAPFDELNNLITTKTKKMVDLKVREWKKLGVFDGYLALRLAKLGRVYTNRDAIDVLILGAYLESLGALNDLSRDIFMQVSLDIQEQAKNEFPFKVKALTWSDIDKFSHIGYSLLPYIDYLYSFMINNAFRFSNIIITSLQVNVKPNVDELIRTQCNQLLSINGDKFSGIINDTSTQVANETYVEPLREENHKVKFVAEMDDRTTRMCRSLDGQIFNTKDKNKFKRYVDGRGNIEIEVDGLVSGVNLPPIQNFTHHCRSTVVFVE